MEQSIYCSNTRLPSRRKYHLKTVNASKQCIKRASVTSNWSHEVQHVGLNAKLEIHRAKQKSLSKRASAYVEASPHYCVRSSETRIPNCSQEQNCSVLTIKTLRQSAMRMAQSARMPSVIIQARIAERAAQSIRRKPLSAKRKVSSTTRM